MDRRLFLHLPLAAAARGAEGIRREVFIKSPGKGTAVMGYAFYAKPKGGEMVSVEQRWSRSDTIDVTYRRRSTDHGETWSAPTEEKTGEKRAEGTWRRHPRCGFADPHSGRLIEFINEAVLPTDDPLEGMRRWRLYYRHSGTGDTLHRVIHEGPEFNEDHPLPGVWTGKNSVTVGDHSSAPIALPDGTICLPVEIAPIGPNGEYHNPGGGYTWHVSALLLGRWKGDKLVWRMSNTIELPPTQSTRGILEATVARLPDGRLIMVMRTSNDKRPNEIQSYKWFSISNDGGRTFPPAAPWTYDTGENFFSPSSCSMLIGHTNGRIYWIGNVTPTNPRGNRPRYPLIIGEVDPKSGLLRKKSVRTIDTRGEGENELLTLSNFFAYEDRRDHNIVVYVTRLFAYPDGWEGDSFRYHIPV